MALFAPNIEKLLKDMTNNIKDIDIDHSSTVIVNMDTINGFFKEGNLSSSRLLQIIPKIVKVNEMFKNSDKLFFVDNHLEDSLELKTFPTHCVSSSEQLIISELKQFTTDATVIEKNATNGFFSKNYMRWLSENNDYINNYIIVGAVTDLCVMQYALTKKAYFNQNDIDKKIIVVENAVQTFSTDAHDGNQMHNFALYNMLINGIIIATV